MKRLFPFAALALFCAGLGCAQEGPRFEVSADYSYFHANPSLPSVWNSQNLNGGGGDVTVFFLNHFGVKADLQGYGSTNQCPAAKGFVKHYFRTHAGCRLRDPPPPGSGSLPASFGEKAPCSARRSGRGRSPSAPVHGHTRARAALRPPGRSAQLFEQRTPLSSAHIRRGGRKSAGDPARPPRFAPASRSRQCSPASQPVPFQSPAKPFRMSNLSALLIRCAQVLSRSPTLLSATATNPSPGSRKPQARTLPS